jgi:8-oxo-dGTP diphosphatase
MDSRRLGFLPLQTERLSLRPARLNDAAWLAPMISPFEVSRYTSQVPHPYPEGEAERYLARSIENLAMGFSLSLVITDRSTDQPMGMVGMGIDAILREGELGYWIGQEFWGKGFMSEAVQALTECGLSRLGLRRVHARVFTENPASMQVLRHAGLVECGNGMVLTPARDVEAIESVFFERLAPRQPLLVAAVALVDRDGRVLIAQRPPGKSMAGLWEFPGGKVDPGETPEAALIRELKEELDVDTAESCLAPFTFASYTYEDFHLLMPLYVCRVWEGNPRPMEGQTLAWARPNEIKNYPMPPADKPLVAMLRDLL